jgi:hypothetical protein
MDENTLSRLFELEPEADPRNVPLAGQPNGRREIDARATCSPPDGNPAMN